MSSDLLSRAAAALRHHVAELPVRIQAGWMQDSSEIYTESSSPLHSMRHVGTMSHDEGAEIAYYVILMHPPVALALADWLDGYAALWDRWPKTLQTTGDDPSPAAVALARAILREVPDA